MDKTVQVVDVQWAAVAGMLLPSFEPSFKEAVRFSLREPQVVPFEGGVFDVEHDPADDVFSVMVLGVTNTLVELVHHDERVGRLLDGVACMDSIVEKALRNAANAFGHQGCLEGKRNVLISGSRRFHESNAVSFDHVFAIDRSPDGGRVTKDVVRYFRIDGQIFW